MGTNFRIETMSIIEKAIESKRIPPDWEVDELLIYTGGCETHYYTQKGGKIDWEAMAEALGMSGEDIWDYDDGYGCNVFCGWITFKNSDTWIEREEYDGSEWWRVVTRPLLSKWQSSIDRWNETREEDE